ncbi:protein POLYCHOME-like [Nicotiana sylvestris]|uniref:Protein POLYCHOME-like isoform X1 n=1 Tax=Nicotiana sylvestris TaxID=4096 RepID=A0A1U7XAB9_NICSY|nr:PREDICTED: protein POLYCHOME-like isoform X1 [Nicotiana sylvestris]XP_009786608.1 PREDICTED: protein POLYCHOME-like isoform X2 [Nicotiana sylvestris]
MTEARDRISRTEEDLMEIYSRRRRTTVRNEGGGIVIFQDELEDASATRTIFRPGTTARVGLGGGIGRRVNFGTPRRNSHRTPARVIGRENISPSGRGRGRGGQHSVLPSWYPRTPLRDITSIVRAIERRRARFGEREGQQLESPISQDLTVLDPSESTSGAQLEHNNSFMTPHPTIRSRIYPKSVGKVPKILLNITHQNDSGDIDCLTPQRKLLNSIDKVEKAVMEELHKLKRTPSAKKQEREKRVRTLMSMR